MDTAKITPLLEILNQPLYDTEIFPWGISVAEMRFFYTPMGQTLYNSVGNKTAQDTNMCWAGQLESQQEFYCYGIRCCIMNLEWLRGDVETFRTGTLNFALGHNGPFKFTIPLSEIPTSVGFREDARAAKQWARMGKTHIYPLPFYSVMPCKETGQPLPIVIRAYEFIDVSMQFPACTQFKYESKVKLFLIGKFLRPV